MSLSSARDFFFMPLSVLACSLGARSINLLYEKGSCRRRYINTFDSTNITVRLLVIPAVKKFHIRSATESVWGFFVFFAIFAVFMGARLGIASVQFFFKRY